jgi:hypothetical protein
VVFLVSAPAQPASAPHVRPHLGVVPAPPFDADLRFEQASEPLEYRDSGRFSDP